MINDPLTERIIGCAMKVHRALGPGFLESVYEKALAHELRNAGISFVSQKPIQVTYEGDIVGDFIADLLVEDRVLVENRAVQISPVNPVERRKPWR